MNVSMQLDDRPKSLKQAVESLGLVWRGTCHRGIDDARNVASIVREILALCVSRAQVPEEAMRPSTELHQHTRVVDGHPQGNELDGSRRL